MSSAFTLRPVIERSGQARRLVVPALRELQQVVRSIEAMIGTSKKFVVFLTNYPLWYRQPYSAHLFMDKCMFGRHREKERIPEFLLQMEPPVQRRWVSFTSLARRISARALLWSMFAMMKWCETTSP